MGAYLFIVFHPLQVRSPGACRPRGSLKPQIGLQDACILATGLWCVRTRIKVLCDTELWVTEEIGMFAFFNLLFYYTGTLLMCSRILLNKLNA